MKPHIVYVLVSGHSGSTILQYFLCSRDAALGLGEVRHMGAGKGWSDSIGNCSCGVKTAACPVWRQLEPNEGETSRDWYARLAAHVSKRFPNTDSATVHDVFGNRLRMDPETRSSLKYDDRWQYQYRVNLLALCHYPVWRPNTRLRRLGSPGNWLKVGAGKPAQESGVT